MKKTFFCLDQAHKIYLKSLCEIYNLNINEDKNKIIIIYSSKDIISKEEVIKITKDNERYIDKRNIKSIKIYF